MAYNGETCDLKWIWRYLQAPRTELAMPTCFKFFLDPLKVIKHYKSCDLNPSKSKLESLESGCVWKFISGENLNGAHDSLVDAKAQTDVVVSKEFSSFIDRQQPIRLVEDIFLKKERSKMAQRQEPTRPVHKPWKELQSDEPFSWKPRPEDTYKGPRGGPKHGPTKKMKDAARSGSLADMFLFLALPMTILEYIAARTNTYAFDDWVVPTTRLDREGNAMKHPSILT